MSYVLAFLGFAMLIILHEGGHFLAAKAVGMRVERFSLFFGPMVFNRTVGETEYGVGVIPLGGYVKISGMNPLEVLESDAIEARAYHNQPVWKRVVVIAAGPAVNLVVAFILAWIFFLTVTHQVQTSSGQYVYRTVVAAVQSGGPSAGVLRVGDRIVSVDGVNSSSEAVLHDLVAKHTCAGDAKVQGCRADTPARIVLRREGHLLTVNIRPVYSQTSKSMLLGVGFPPATAPNGVVYAAGQGVEGLWRVTKLTVTDIVEIFKPANRKNLHSIVGVYEVTQQSIASGFADGIQILALISLSLAIINLFPFLPLDGGHIFWALAEKLRGHAIPPIVVERASFFGIALIAVLLFVGLSNDVHTIANGGFNVH